MPPLCPSEVYDEAVPDMASPVLLLNVLSPCTTVASPNAGQLSQLASPGIHSRLNSAPASGNVSALPSALPSRQASMSPSYSLVHQAEMASPHAIHQVGSPVKHGQGQVLSAASTPKSIHWSVTSPTKRDIVQSHPRMPRAVSSTSSHSRGPVSPDTAASTMTAKNVKISGSSRECGRSSLPLLPP